MSDVAPNNTTAVAPKQRLALFDNIKAILIILVVFGHAIYPVQNDNPALSFLFDTIYLFHMPLFVFVSGLFAKGAYRDGRLNVDRILSFGVLGVAFQAAVTVVSKRPLDLEALTCFASAPWYLICMAWWYLATPILHRLGPARGMAIALAASLAQGLLDTEDGFLAIGRALSFLPFFAAGYYTSPKDVVRLRGHRLSWVAVGISALIIGARLVDPQALGWFFYQVFGDNPYNTAPTLGMVQKLAALAAGAVVSIAAIRLTPVGRMPVLTTLGRRTMQVYIAHRLLRAWLTFHTTFYRAPILLDPLAGPLVGAALTALMIAICWPAPLEAAFNRLLGIRWTAKLAQRS